MGLWLYHKGFFENWTPDLGYHGLGYTDYSKIIHMKIWRIFQFKKEYFLLIIKCIKCFSFWLQKLSFISISWRKFWLWKDGFCHIYKDIDNAINTIIKSLKKNTL